MSSSVFLTSITVVLLFLQLPLYNAFILDVDGDPIRNGGKYFIVSVASEGTLTYIHRHNKCPLFITQEYAVENSTVGTPVIISTPPKILYIPLGFAVALTFTGSVSDTPCKESLGWKVSPNPLQRRQYITTGGHGFAPNFIITKRDKSLKPTYELKYCAPQDLESCSVNVGLFEDNGLLGLTQHPTTFSFKKAFDVHELATS